MASKLFPSLAAAAAASAALLFHFFLKRRSRETNRGEANNDAAANEGTAEGASGAHTPTGVREMATSSGPTKDAAPNDATTGGDSGADTTTGVPEMATSSGPVRDAAASDGTAGGDSGARTSTGVPEMATSSGANNGAAANDGTAGGASGAYTSTGVPEMATSSGLVKDAAANDGTAGGDFGAHTSTGVPEMATSSGLAKDAATSDGTAAGDSSAHTSTGVPEMATSSGANNDAAANDGTAGGASGADTSTESHEMAISSGDNFEVFLSFRGPDTRAGITDFLYTSLTDAGIGTFRDDESLRKGEEFAPKLLQAIKQSKILVPIFSKDYAASVWCLKEVVQMVECKKTGGQKIVPVFYDVEPAEVRYQTGGYGEAFRSHENKKRHDEKTIGEWKAALNAVGELNGWNLHKEGKNRREGEFVKKFTREVFNELKKASLIVSDNLVDVDNHVGAIMGMIGAQTNETQIVGIHGMGGIGKTTTAKIIYNRLLENFEGCCFLSNIREMSEKPKGIEYLQNQLISDILKNKCTAVTNIDDGIKIIKDRLRSKRVLLLLDDLYEKKHMDELVGECDWFGKGSKLIITTRNKETLVALGVNDFYELTGMDHGQSLKLFSKYAFKRDSPLNEYINQSNRAIDIAGGLPLALEVMGSLLYCTKKEMWDARLKELENVPHDKIQRTMKISYDALQPCRKDIFLDIACLFIGYDKDILIHFWDEPYFLPEVAMEDLQNMSLIKINEDNKVWMHDLLRDFGREMVRQESGKKIQKQTRVWDHKQGLDLLGKHKGEKEVQALRLKLEHQSQRPFTYDGFDGLSNLRFLEVDDCRKYSVAKEESPLWHESLTNVLPTNGNSDLLPNLRWLSWSYFPLALNIANFSMEDVVILDLPKSKITDEWKGWSHMKVMKNLKVLNLSECENLRSLPDELGRDLASLEYLSLNGCECLETLPDSIGNLESLIELDIRGTKIKELPDSIGKLKNLKRLKMEASFISEIPNALWTIENFEELEVCRNFNASKNFRVSIGNCIHKNQSMRILKLKFLEIHAVPKLPESLVTLDLSWLSMDTFPALSNLTNLKELRVLFRSRDSHEESYGPAEEYPILRGIGNLSKIFAVPKLPESLVTLHLGSLYMDTFPDLSNLTNLKELDLSFQSCHPYRESDGPLEEYPMPRWIGNLSKLESLRLCCDFVTTSPTDLILPPQVKKLELCNCPKLRCLPRLPSTLSSLRLERCDSLCSMEDLDLSSPHLTSLHLVCCPVLRRLPRLPSSLSFLYLRSCNSLRSMEDLDLSSPQLKKLELHNCTNLRRLPRLPSSLSSLLLFYCTSLCSMGDLSNLKNLSSLDIYSLSSPYSVAIEEIQDLGCLKNLRQLMLSGLGQVKTLPDLGGNLNELRSLNLRRCPNLVEIRGKLPQSLEVLTIDSCESLRKLPDLSNLEKLRNLQIQSCANLVAIESEFPKCLEKLEISSCINIQELPNLSRLNGLRKVKIYGCVGLDVGAISSLCSEKSITFLGDEWDGEDAESESEYDWGEEE